MSKGNGRWDDGRRAWQRLSKWHQRISSAAADHPDDDEGDGAAGALADIGVVRRLLDQAELLAVRAARRHGKSWAEIATQLGVTRQSAWERWRDLDDDTDAPDPAGTESQDDAIAAAASELIRGAAGSLEVVPSEAIEPAARERRKHASVVVPSVVGRSWDEARQALHAVGLVAVGPDPDAPPQALLRGEAGIVTDQSPEAGAKVPAGSPVTLWVEDGGGSGVREPRRPKPVAGTGREMHAEPSDEAVG